MNIHEYGDRDAEIVLIQPVDEHDLASMEEEIAFLREKAAAPFRLAAFRIGRWNQQLSPWPAPAVFGREDFGSGAPATLEDILHFCREEGKRYFLGGYSLAGLFALWSAYQTDLFQGIAAASPSLWFPGFDAYMREHEIRCSHVYLSLGDREERTRNPVMATVGDRIRSARALLSEQGANCLLEWNEGNHFRDAPLRTARAFLWVMEHGS